MGLTAGPVPPRADARVKAGLLELIDHASGEGGWSLRRSAAALGVEHARVLRWQARAAAGQLDDRRPGPEQAAHALPGWEKDAICKLAGERGEAGPQPPQAGSPRLAAAARGASPKRTISK